MFTHGRVRSPLLPVILYVVGRFDSKGSYRAIIVRMYRMPVEHDEFEEAVLGELRSKGEQKSVVEALPKHPILGRKGKGKRVQRLWLEAFAELGTEADACKAVGIRRRTVRVWESEDRNGFIEAYQEVRDIFRDHIESILFRRCEEAKCHPLLLIFANKALNRAKYGDEVRVNEEDKLGREMIAEFRKWAKLKGKGPEVLDVTKVARTAILLEGLQMPRGMEPVSEESERRTLEGEGGLAVSRMQGLIMRERAEEA